MKTEQPRKLRADLTPEQRAEVRTDGVDRVQVNEGPEGQVGEEIVMAGKPFASVCGAGS